MKYKVPFSMAFAGAEDGVALVPTGKSATTLVPAMVPLLDQTASLPVAGSVARKSVFPFRFIRYEGGARAEPELLNCTVPATVPLLAHRDAVPGVGKLPRKNSIPFAFVKSVGLIPPLAVLALVNGTVPAAVPSLAQSCTPVLVWAVKYTVPPATVKLLMGLGPVPPGVGLGLSVGTTGPTEPGGV